MTEQQIVTEILIPQFKVLTSAACDENTSLVGPAAAIDSVNLVTYLLEVEEILNSKLGKKIRIVSDRALAEKNSPFASISSLASYIGKLLNTP